MKKLMFFVVFSIMMGITAAAQTPAKVEKNGNTFTAVKGSGSSYDATGFYYVDTDGARYEIYVHTTQKGKNAGQTKCYIRKTSAKSGKQYWKEIPVRPEELTNN